MLKFDLRLGLTFFIKQLMPHSEWTKGTRRKTIQYAVSFEAKLRLLAIMRTQMRVRELDLIAKPAHYSKKSVNNLFTDWPKPRYA